MKLSALQPSMCVVAVSCLVAFASTVLAEPSYGVSLSNVRERRSAWLLGVAIDIPIRSDVLLEVAGGLGIVAEEHVDRALAYEARVGVLDLACNVSRQCLGLAGGIGYHRQQRTIADDLAGPNDPEKVDHIRDLGFAEARILGRLPASARTVVEAAIAVRLQDTFRTKNDEGGLEAAVVFSLALHLTP